jgi:hypothetical protein
VKSHHALISLIEHDLRANAFSRLSRGKPVPTFPDHALKTKGPTRVGPVCG